MYHYRGFERFPIGLDLKARELFARKFAPLSCRRAQGTEV
jgi:hypothetical protein